MAASDHLDFIRQSLAEFQWKPSANEGAEDDEASSNEGEEGAEAVAD